MNDKNDYSQEKSIEEVSKLHSSEMQLCMSIVYIPILRDVIANHISNFIDKSSSAGSNRRHIGLTKIVVGTRFIKRDKLILSSIERSADKTKKESDKSNIECVLSMIGMQLKLIEERVSQNEDCKREYADIAVKLRYLNLHQNIRIDIYKKTDVIFEACRKVERALQIFIRKNIEFYTSYTPTIFMAGEYNEELFKEQELDLTEEKFVRLRQEFITKHSNELSSLGEACGVDDISEVIEYWQDIKVVSTKYKDVKSCRDIFVMKNQPFVRSIVNETLRRHIRNLDAESKREKIDCYLASAMTMLLEKVYKYNPEYSFTTFAKNYIEQECQKSISNDDIVKLPSVLANKQKEVLEAGLTTIEGKEYFDEELALKTMRNKYPGTFWTSDTIADVRFKNTKSTISMHQDSEDEGVSFEERLCDDSANPESEAEKSEWAISVVKAISTLPNTQRERAIQRIGITASLFNELNKNSSTKKECHFDRSHIINELLKSNDF